MKKFFAIFLTFVMVFSLVSCQTEQEGPFPEGSELPETEPDEYIRLTEGVSKEMLSADFWTSRVESEEVLMTEKEISAFNERNKKQIAWADVTYSLKEFPERVSGDIVREYVATAMPEDPSAYYVNGQPATEEYFETIDENRALDQIPDVVDVRYGYAVRRAELRTYPTNDFGVTDPENFFYDELIYGQCFPYCPLVVLHESLDGNWYYVFFDGFGSWVTADAVALCRSRADWLRRQEEDCFLLVTGREIRLPHDEGCPGVSELLLPMGTKLPLVPFENTPETVRMRIGYGCYTVLLPTRAEDGYIKDEYAFVSTAEDVSVGFLPYSPQNVVRLAFKFLGDRYGWAGGDLSNDCSGMIRQIYDCFGFTLPRTDSMQIKCKGLKTFDLTDLPDEEKRQTIASLPMGSLLQFPGHIMLYIGTVDGVNYVINSVGSFATMEMETGDYQYVNTCCINSLEQTRRGNGDTWLTNMTFAGYPAPEEKTEQENEV